MKFYAFNTTDNVRLVDGKLMKVSYKDHRVYPSYEKVDTIEIDALQNLLAYIDSKADGGANEVIVYRKQWFNYDTRELVSTDKWCIEYYNGYRE